MGRTVSGAMESTLQSTLNHEEVMTVREQDQMSNESQNTADSTSRRDVSSPEQTHEKDDMRSWLMCLSSMAVGFAVYGFYSSYGLFLNELLQEFQESKAKTAWVGSLATATHFTCYVLVGYLMYHLHVQTITIVGAVFMAVGLSMTSLVHNLELMYLTYGILYGIGTGFGYGPVVASVPDHFEKRKSLVIGLLVCASSIGQIVYPPFIVFLLHRYSWRQVFRIAVFSPACVLICSFTFKKRDLSVRTTSKKQEYLAFLKDKLFVLWCIAVSMVLSTLWVVPHFLVLYCKSLGYSTDDGSLLLTYYGGASMVCELTAGVVLDLIKKVPKIYVYMFITVIGVAANVQVAFATSYGLLVLFACVDGMVVGALKSTSILLTMEILGDRSFRIAYGIYNFFLSCLQMAAPPAAGLLYDMYQSFTPIFLMSAMTYVMANCILFPLSRVILKKRKAREVLVMSEQSGGLIDFEFLTSL